MSLKVNNELSQAIRDTRKQVLNSAQLVCGNDSRWPALRSQLLKIFGSNGLERFLVQDDGWTDENGHWDGNR